MQATQRLKEAGSVVFGCLFLVGLFAVGVALLTGAAEFSIWILKWTFPAFSFYLFLTLVLLVPLSLIRPTRDFSAAGMLLSSYIFGAILWVWGMAYAYSVWGMIGVIAGLVFFGVGVVPVALFAALIHADWSTFGMLVFGLFVTFGFRTVAHWLTNQVDDQSQIVPRDEQATPASRIED